VRAIMLRLTQLFNVTGTRRSRALRQRTTPPARDTTRRHRGKHERLLGVARPSNVR